MLICFKVLRLTYLHVRYGSLLYHIVRGSFHPRVFFLRGRGVGRSIFFSKSFFLCTSTRVLFVIFVWASYKLAWRHLLCSNSVALTQSFGTRCWMQNASLSPASSRRVASRRMLMYFVNIPVECLADVMTCWFPEASLLRNLCITHLFFHPECTYYSFDIKLEQELSYSSSSIQMIASRKARGCVQMLCLATVSYRGVVKPRISNENVQELLMEQKLLSRMIKVFYSLTSIEGLCLHSCTSLLRLADCTCHWFRTDSLHVEVAWHHSRTSAYRKCFCRPDTLVHAWKKAWVKRLIFPHLRSVHLVQIAIVVRRSSDAEFNNQPLEWCFLWVKLTLSLQLGE